MPNLEGFLAIVTILTPIVLAWFVFRGKLREAKAAQEIAANNHKVAEDIATNTSKVAESSSMVSGYGLLFDNMRKSMEGAQTQIECLRTQIEKLQLRYTTDSDLWRTEKVVLEHRVECLETENTALKTALKDLQEQNVALKATLEEIRRPTSAATV